MGFRERKMAAKEAVGWSGEERHELPGSITEENDGTLNSIKAQQDT